ncbi:hypothetical protein [uncultured Polaribacter sp.]|uniref:hypothetical protein n=1 Tax=uncultured Polaribacter sp. TaxID=174711 RepID=UPI002625FAB6|nr:hypothetical protein [uncultured Polaribacter sp.]
MYLKKLVILCFVLLLFSNCAMLLNVQPQLNYIGNYYAPTENVVLLFDEKEINFNYSVMGLLSFVDHERGVFFSDGNIDYNQLIIEKAKKVGADAVLITNFSNSQRDEITEDINDKQLTVETKNVINVKAKFLKFKN